MNNTFTQKIITIRAPRAPTSTGGRSAGQVITYSAAGNSDKLTFTYDANGNILTEKLNNAAYHSYVYDGLNQLVRENNVAAGKTWVYTYDNAGNILSKKEYAYTTATDLSSLTPLDTITYTYGDSEWKDLLTAYDGQAITYDAIGNPTNYRGRQHYWSGRDLNTVVVGSAGAVQFAYNAAGQRISKSYANNTTKFYYDDSGNLIGMRQNYDQPIKFQVNYATGEIDGFTQGTNTYWYRKNQQGDVTGIFSINYGNTALFVEYEYDAWGNVISITGDGASTIGVTNPIRYRGYFYDTETGYYYLNSRYYDPVTHRFLNGDVYASTGQGTLGSNMFVYCLNNPVNGIDLNGETTYSVGLNFSAFLLGGVSYSIFISWDDSGNLVLQTSEADVFRKKKGGVFGLASIGTSLFASRTELDTVYDLEGWAQSTGGPVGIFGGEVITNYDTGEKIGDSISVGKSVGLDVHTTIAETETITVIKTAPSNETSPKQNETTSKKESSPTTKKTKKIRGYVMYW